MTESFVTGWEPTASISCAAVTGAPTLTTNNTTRTMTASLNTTNSAAACTVTNTKKSKISLIKNVASRVVAADQFNVSVSGAGSSSLTNLSDTAIAASAVTITTSGSGTGNFTNPTNPSFYSTGGLALTLSDAMAAGSTSTIAEYDTRLTCTNAYTGTGATPNASLPNNQSTASTSITPASGDDITCTYTNTPKPRITLQKAIAVTGGGRVAATDQFALTNGATTGTTTGTGSTVTSSALLFVGTSGSSVTLSEAAAGTTSLSNYNSSISCSNSTAGSVTTLPSGAGTSFTLTPVNRDVISCTLTNTRKSANLTLRKTWVSAQVNNTVTVTATGLTSLSSTANTANETDTGSAQTVFAGAAITLGETFGTGSATNYTSGVACTGNANALSSNVLTVSGADTAITCTYTNTGASDMTPSFTYMPNTAIVGTSYYGKYICTNNGIAAASIGSTCAISLPSGLSATCTPSVPTAATVAVGASINCTVSGTPTSAGTSSMVITTGATNDGNGGTTSGGNNQTSQSVTIVNESAAGICSPGTTTNLVSPAPFILYEDVNTVTPVTTNVPLVSSPATYVLTGSNSGRLDIP